MRPCDDCNGSGKVVKDHGYDNNLCAGHGSTCYEDCSRCVDMPWLPAKKGTYIVDTSVVNAPYTPAKFKPDPDSIGRFCFDHGMFEDGHYDAFTKDTELGLCDFGWVENPTRLAVVF